MRRLRASYDAHPGLGVALALGAAVAWNLTSIGAGANRLVDGLGVSLGTVGVLAALLWLSHALSQLPGGQLIDRLGARRVAVVVLVGLLVLNALACVSPHVPLLGVNRLLTGCFVGTGSLCAIMYMRGPTAVAKGFVGASTSAGAALPLAIVPAAGAGLGWRAPFVFGAVFAALALLVVLRARAVPEPAAVEEDVSRPRLALPALIRDGTIVRLSVLLSAQTILSWTMGNWIVPILTTTDGRFDVAVAGVLGAMILAGGIVSRPVGAYLTSHTRVSGRLLIATCLLGGAASVGVIAAQGPVPLTAAAVLTLGVTASMPWAVILHAAAVAHPRTAASAVGAVGTAGTLAAVASIPAFGAAFDAGHELAALWGLAALAASSVLVLVRRRDQAVAAAASSAFEPEGSGNRP